MAQRDDWVETNVPQSSTPDVPGRTVEVMDDDDPDRRRPALGRPWTRQVARVLATMGRTCHICLRPGVATSADHLLPRSLGGTDEMSNLAPICPRCNSIRGNGTVAAARAKVQAATRPMRPTTSRDW
jgi:5-methylcytosine-specific restriction endonuclease McrA